MPRKVAIDQEVEQAMIRLGKLIFECRGKRSLRKISEPSGIPASQLQYIERGTMAPTAEVYPKLLETLQPDEKQRAQMDRLYMAIRKTPPPDVCELIINNQNLIPVLRAMGDGELGKKQISLLLASVSQEKIEGERNNGQNI